MHYENTMIKNPLSTIVIVKQSQICSEYVQEKTKVCLKLWKVILLGSSSMMNKNKPLHLINNKPMYLNKKQKWTLQNVEPHSNIMEVESQTKLEWLCNKKVMKSNFEATLDGLVGDGQSIIMEFQDWTGFGPTYDFNELRNALCGEAKLCFNADELYLYGLAYIGRESKKIWISRKIELVGIEFQRHPNSLEKLLDFDKDASSFYFQQSLSINAINKETQSIDRKLIYSGKFQQSMQKSMN